MNHLSSRVLFLSAALSLTAPNLNAGDVVSYGVAKGSVFEQRSTLSPTPFVVPFGFISGVEMSDNRAVSRVSLRLPTGDVELLERTAVATQTGIEYGFTLIKYEYSKADLDQHFPSGSYQFTMDAREGRKTPSLNLGTDAYPGVGKVINWTDVQAVESDFPLTVSWTPFVGGTENDFIALQIADSNGDAIFSSPDSIPRGAIRGNQTRFTIPAGVLPANGRFMGGLTFFKTTGRNTTALPDAIGETAYFTMNLFPIITLPEPSIYGRFQFASSTFAVNEARNEAVVKVTRAGSVGPASVVFKTANGTATAGQDYTAVNETLFFEDGATSMNVVIPLQDDFRREGNEGLRVSLSSPSTGATLGVRKTALLTIVDNELISAGILQFGSARISVSETNTVARINVIRTGGLQGTVSARYSTMTGSATGSVDYAGKSGIVQFAPGQTSKVISVSLINDTLDETNETFSVTLSHLTGGAALGANKATTVTILDNDVAGQVAFSSAGFAVNENGTNAVVLVTRSGGKAGGVSVDYSTGVGTATAEDFTAVSGTLSFAANETSKSILIPITWDLQSEGEEAFTVQLTNPGGGLSLGTVTSASVTIANVDSGAGD